MAEETITAANVLQSSNFRVRAKEYVAEEAISVGQVVCAGTASTQVLLATNTSATKHIAIGIALNSAPGVGQKVDVLSIDPDFNPGFTVALGKVYVLGATGGSIMPVDDIAGTEYVTVIGVGEDATSLRVNITPESSSRAIAASAVS